jgi:hypothetical protein
VSSSKETDSRVLNGKVSWQTSRQDNYEGREVIHSLSENIRHLTGRASCFIDGTGDGKVAGSAGSGGLDTHLGDPTRYDIELLHIPEIGKPFIGDSTIMANSKIEGSRDDEGQHRWSDDSLRGSSPLDWSKKLTLYRWIHDNMINPTIEGTEMTKTFIGDLTPEIDLRQIPERDQPRPCIGHDKMTNSKIEGSQDDEDLHQWFDYTMSVTMRDPSPWSSRDRPTLHR